VKKQKKKLTSLFTSSESETKESARKLWDFSDDAYIEVISLGDLYPGLYMPPEVADIQTEVLVYHKFPEKDRELALEWINKNIMNMN
jgi:hypothetical protein